MADDKMTSAAARLTGLAVVLALGTFYVFIGHQWYFTGKMLLCTYEETVKQGSWCYKAYPTAGVEGGIERHTGLGNIDETYHGKHRYYSDDIAGNTISTLGAMVINWFNEFINGWFWQEFAPQWNAFFSVENSSAEGHRLAFGAIVGIFYAALVSTVISSLLDWMRGK
jgi:hypothetical protein